MAIENSIQFKRKCAEHLNKTYGKFFDLLGGGCSSVSDIKFVNGKSSYIECKLPHTQSDKFELVPNSTNTNFELSKSLEPAQAKWFEGLINYLSKPEVFRNLASGNVGGSIAINKFQLFQWFKKAMARKNIRYVVSTQNSDTESAQKFFIFPVGQIQDYFDIRVKITPSVNATGAVSGLAVTYSVTQKPNISDVDAAQSSALFATQNGLSARSDATKAESNSSENVEVKEPKKVASNLQPKETEASKKMNSILKAFNKA
ncbi:hypothetical protein [Taylorella asinigenitalis]|uniref:hypothetical protein n=1 Tax=Taylorella asinigenitalis TaxID=84590 RepID=UPI000490327F|nr:hypothetical protein [Taylorella asinigenitalis]